MERYVLAFSSSLERIRNYVPITKLQLKKVLLVWVIGVGGGGLSQVGCPFLGGLRSEWMKSGHGGRGGVKKGRKWMDVTVPYHRLVGSFPLSIIKMNNSAMGLLR